MESLSMMLSNSADLRELVEQYYAFADAIKNKTEYEKLLLLIYKTENITQKAKILSNKNTQEKNSLEVLISEKEKSLNALNEELKKYKNSDLMLANKKNKEIIEKDYSENFEKQYSDKEIAYRNYLQDEKILLEKKKMYEKDLLLLKKALTDYLSFLKTSKK